MSEEDYMKKMQELRSQYKSFPPDKQQHIERNLARKKLHSFRKLARLKHSFLRLECRRAQLELENDEKELRRIEKKMFELKEKMYEIFSENCK